MEEEEEELKASGNAAFKKGDFASAVDFFSRAIDVSSKKNNIENHHVLYSNRSAARVRRNRQSRLFIHRKWSLFSGERFFFGRRRSNAFCTFGRSVWTLLSSSKKVEKNVVRRFSGGIQTSSPVSGGGAREEEEEEIFFRKDEKLFSSPLQKEEEESFFFQQTKRRRREEEERKNAFNKLWRRKQRFCPPQ